MSLKSKSLLLGGDFSFSLLICVNINFFPSVLNIPQLRSLYCFTVVSTQISWYLHTLVPAIFTQNKVSTFASFPSVLFYFLAKSLSAQCKCLKELLCECLNKTIPTAFMNLKAKFIFNTLIKQR